MRRRRRLSTRFLEAETQVRVRFQEVDTLGVVWHGHYLSYFEDARVRWGERFDFDYETIRRAGCVAPLVHTEVDHFLPARFGDRLTVRARLHDEPGARLTFTYDVASESGERLAKGRTDQAFVDLDGELVLTRPDFYETFLARVAPEFREA